MKILKPFLYYWSNNSELVCVGPKFYEKTICPFFGNNFLPLQLNRFAFTKNNTLIIIKYMQMAGIMPQTGISIRTLHRIHRNSVHKPRRIIRTDVKTRVWGKLSYCLFIQVSSPLYDIRPYDNGMKTVVSLLIRNTRFQ